MIALQSHMYFLLDQIEYDPSPMSVSQSVSVAEIS